MSQNSAPQKSAPQNNVWFRIARLRIPPASEQCASEYRLIQNSAPQNATCFRIARLRMPHASKYRADKFPPIFFAITVFQRKHRQTIFQSNFIDYPQFIRTLNHSNLSSRIRPIYGTSDAHEYDLQQARYNCCTLVIVDTIVAVITCTLNGVLCIK